MSNENPETSSSLLSKNRQNLIVGGLLLVILAVGTFLRFFQLGESGYGNMYYAAAVKSMLISWKNFFFVAFEPGGSVSVDKPPLGFWIEAVSAYFLGVNGFALALPNASAGVLSIFVVYKLVRRPFGPWIGLVAALVLAIMPISIATERNNTIDGMLVFVLLLAALAFLEATYTGKLRWLLLGAFIVGLGFNIKMLQAFLPLPAFYAIYFFGANLGWGRKIAHLALATFLLTVVSLSWAIAVDLTPASERPYMDSSTNNTVMELIVGHNGLSRLWMNRGQDGRNAPQGIGDDTRPQPPQGQSGQGLPPGQQNGQNFQPGQFPQGQQPPQMGDSRDGNQPGGQGSMDFGTPGLPRLFTQPLSDEASWLLPFVIGGLVVLANRLLGRIRLGEQNASPENTRFTGFDLQMWCDVPKSAQTIALILWAGWLIPEMIYFTYSGGIMHAYYLIMFGASIASLTGMTVWALAKLIGEQKWAGIGITALLAVFTLVFQTITLWSNASFSGIALAFSVALLGLGLFLAAGSRLRGILIPVTLALVMASLLIAPATWSVLTALNSSPNSALPNSGPAYVTSNSPMRQNTPDNSGVNQKFLDFLLENTTPGTYLLATGRSNDAAGYILETGRPALAFGGFGGQTNVVTPAQLAALVNSGHLRFVLGSSLDQHPELGAWVRQNCSAFDAAAFGGTLPFSSNPSGKSGINSLYDCQK